MDSLYLARLSGRGGRHTELARQLVQLQGRLDELARVAGQEQLRPGHLQDEIRALQGASRYAVEVAEEVLAGLTNRDVFGEQGSVECDLDPEGRYAAL